jgi:hypothetical protein
VSYVWAGTSIDKEDGETWSRAIARWFAQLAANQELASDNLDFRFFDKYKMKTEAYIEAKIDRVIQGRLFPGSEVVCIAMAREVNVPMFEFRWFPVQRLLKHTKKELIRQYEAEPTSEKSVFGLHMHLKAVNNVDDEQIRAMQNEQIAIAMDYCELYEKEGWPDEVPRENS